MTMFFINTRKYKEQLICYFKNRFATINESPIIVIGNQKAGTSAIAHLLADFGGLSKTIDIPPLWGPEVFKIMRGQIDFARIVRRHRFYFSTKLIKEPNMTFFTNQVIKTFPKAKYLFIIRDPRDNIRSMLNRMNIPGHLSELPFSVISSDMRKMMLDASTWGGDETENYIGALAHKWNNAFDNYLLYQDRIILVKYEDFLVDKYSVIEKLAKQLGISKKIDITDKLDVQYQPHGNRSVSLENFFGMENLMRIERICGSRMKEFGYSGCNTPVHD